MKFEKLNENKIRVIFTTQDLQEKEIDFHSFMANPLETQDLFLDMLEEAEEKVGFCTKNHKVKIEALAMADGDFMVTITKIAPEVENNRLSTVTPKKKFKVHRKSQELKTSQTIYKFESFDDYCSFIQFLSQNNITNATTIAKNISVYIYNEQYYLVLDDINKEHKNLIKFSSCITEFATYVNNSMLFASKLKECGKIVIKNNALRTSLKHFKSKTTN